MDTPIGSTVPSMIITIGISIIVNKIFIKRKRTVRHIKILKKGLIFVEFNPFSYIILFFLKR